MNEGGDIGNYNKFCGNLVEGSILYNIDSTNRWGEYLLVASISVVRISGMRTYTVLLIGLTKEEGNYKPRNLCIKLTPDYAKNVPFLKYVGHCNFTLVPELSNIDINVGLVTVYGNVDLHKFAEKLSIRKPRRGKYDKDGKLVIKKPSSK